MDETQEQDLELAATIGLFLLGETGTIGGVQLDGPLLRYDPALSAGDRALLVCEAIRQHLDEKSNTTR